MKSVNPHNGKLIKEYTPHIQEQVEKILTDTHTASKDWSALSIEQRGELMRKAAQVLNSDKEHYAHLMAKEMGKVLSEGVSEVEKCAWVCEYYADNAQEFLAPISIKTDAQDSYVRFDPLGTVLGIMPWNFPFWQVFRFAVPALMAGNTALLKHSSNVSGCALEIEDVFKKAGFPDNIFRTLLIPGSDISSVIEDSRVSAISLTGSAPAGISASVSAAKKLKKSVLELGGSDPYLVFEDAELDLAIEKISKSRMINSGQSCIAAKRFIVHKNILPQFSEALIQKFESLNMGDPTIHGSDIGPQAKEKLRDELHDQVLRSEELGAKILLGGKKPDGPGAYYPPTLLSEVKKGMPAFDEELFGPVGAIISFESDEEALELANDSDFGLGSAIFTQDKTRIGTFTSKLQAGCVFVNDFVKSDPRLPFGGIKTSGHGRELSDFGIREFVNIKSVSINY